MKSLLSYLSKFFHSSRAAFINISVALVFLTALPAASAASITGVVTNRTTGKPSVGDTVALIRLQQGMQVADQAKTDVRGHYVLQVTDTDPMHLVRVTHDGANYFKAAPPGTRTADVEVYNAAEKVKGISTEADVQRMETDQNGLRVTENFFVKNVSSPPMTQFGPRAYQIYLPKDAQIVSAAALGPGSMPVQATPMPLGPPGAYAFVFPIRPGETRFQIAYHMPYSGSFQFEPRVTTPVDNFALILPKTIQFAGTPAAAFQPIDQDVNVQTYLAKNVVPGTRLAFHISGTGQLPQETAATQGAPNAGADGNSQQGASNPEAVAQAAAVSNTRPGIGLGVPIDTPDPLHKYKWWIISLVVVLLAVGAGVSMKQAAPAENAPGTSLTGNLSAMHVPATGAAIPRATTLDHQSTLLQALKEELFALESDRLEGHLSQEEYDRQKSALEVVLKRALDRGPGNAATV